MQICADGYLANVTINTHICVCGIVRVKLVGICSPWDRAWMAQFEQSQKWPDPMVSSLVNPSNAEATFVYSTRTQRFLTTILTLPCWYSLESSR